MFLNQNNIKKYCENKVEFYSEFSKLELNQELIKPSVIIDSDFFQKIQTERLMELKFTERKIAFKKLFPDIDDVSEYGFQSVYWFKLVRSFDNPPNAVIIDKYSDIKDPSKGWWSKVDKSRRNSDTEYLYVGKIKIGLYGRFLQHIGLGHPMTSSLKLKEWVGELSSLKLQFYYLDLSRINTDYLSDMEIIFWNELKPLLGESPQT